MSKNATTNRMSDDELSANLKTLALRKKIFGVLALLCIPALFYVVAIDGVYGIPAMIVLVVFIVFWVKTKNKMSASIKRQVLPGVLNEIFTGCAYDAGGIISENAIRKADLVDAKWDKRTGSDYVKGKYKGRNFEFSDVKLVETDGIKSVKDDVAHQDATHFMGQWVVCKPDKPLKGWVRVNENTKLYGKDKELYAKFGVVTENAAFNEQYLLTADNPQTAFNALTPQFMEFIAAADRKTGRKTMFYFGDDELHIALHTYRDSFELGKNKNELKDISLLRQRFRSELANITALLDALFLNESLFKREGE